MDTSFKTESSIVKSKEKRNDNIRKIVYTVASSKRQNRLNKNSQASSSSSNGNDTNLVGKFVLPTRSLHSSRVIKPNKKFINNEQIVTKNNECVKNVFKRILPTNKLRQRTESPDTNTKIFKNKKPKLPPEMKLKEPEEQTETDKQKTETKHINYLQEHKNDTSDTVVIDSINKSTSSWSCGKLILRKARLQLHTQTSDTSDGPFSSYNSSTINPPGTVTCGVCGAVRFYRFVKQARKFNIYSCESCRKFISKMIKRQACSKNLTVPSLICHKGQGNHIKNSTYHNFTPIFFSRYVSCSSDRS